MVRVSVFLTYRLRKSETDEWRLLAFLPSVDDVTSEDVYGGGGRRKNRHVDGYGTVRGTRQDPCQFMGMQFTREKPKVTSSVWCVHQHCSQPVTRIMLEAEARDLLKTWSEVCVAVGGYDGYTAESIIDRGSVSRRE